MSGVLLREPGTFASRPEAYLVIILMRSRKTASIVTRRLPKNIELPVFVAGRGNIHPRRLAAGFCVAELQKQ